jgi:A/G-specific adenine glycosylase
LSRPRAERSLAEALLDHFDVHRRPMPWRETSDPYGIWVSEVMLQQTRVDTVIPYWERWLERFPTVGALADAELDDVLKHWEGLGYYSRARHLHSAARMVRERYDGAVPGTTEELRRLPGVGEYTAGAVASIAFGVPEPAVDGNVRRVLSRLYDLEAPTARELRERAAALVPEDRPGDFNQALMELGATLCSPRSPECARCPLADRCVARRLGVQEQRPRPAARKTVPEETVRTRVLVRPDGSLLLLRRPLEGLLGGLWEFPAAPRLEALAGAAAAAAAALSPGRGLALAAVTHAFSHKRVTYEPVLIGLTEDESAGVAESETVRWATPDAFGQYALPVAQQKIARLAMAAVEQRSGA